MAAYYTVKKASRKTKAAHPNVVCEVTSANPHAIQNFHSWGSDQNAVDASFYGRATGLRGARGEQWEWLLTRAGVDEMCRLIRTYVDDPKFYSKGSEMNAARELLKKLTAVKAGR